MGCTWWVVVLLWALGDLVGVWRVCFGGLCAAVLLCRIRPIGEGNELLAGVVFVWYSYDSFLAGGGRDFAAATRGWIRWCTYGFWLFWLSVFLPSSG
ncbi:hypothetical protein U1Q18_033811 [Sarracenia purpurea var. burkii]